ncbi:MAG: PilZ domain-containing protein [Alphaproteobacteria bacterium]|nr:PilZ domain-containing protein [Alphaproteobacteria bacterium]
MDSVPLVRSHGPLASLLGSGASAADLLLPDRRVQGTLLVRDGTLCFDADDDFTLHQTTQATVDTEIGRHAHRFSTWVSPGPRYLLLDWPDELQSRDRRRFERVPLPDASYQLRLVGAVERCVTLLDISQNGASFVDDLVSWSPGDRVEAEVSLGSGLPSRVIFDVRAVQPLGSGVRVHGRFLPLDDHQPAEDTPLSAEAAAAIAMLAASMFHD